MNWVFKDFMLFGVVIRCNLLEWTIKCIENSSVERRILFIFWIYAVY